MYIVVCVHVGTKAHCWLFSSIALLFLRFFFKFMGGGHKHSHHSTLWRSGTAGGQDSSLVPPCGFRDQTQAIRLGAKHHLTNPLFLEAGFSLNLELAYLARLAGWPASHSSLSLCVLSPRCWGYRHVLPTPRFLWVLEIWTYILVLVWRESYCLNLSPALLSLWITAVLHTVSIFPCLFNLFLWMGT